MGIDGAARPVLFGAAVFGLHIVFHPLMFVIVRKRLLPPRAIDFSCLPHANFTVQLHMVSALPIAALYFFSSYQHRFQIAQLTAEELARMANTDELTRLANRRRMTELIDSELLRYARYGHARSVVMIDIDHFKSVNDQFGHAVGDQVLAALAQRSQEYLREVDTMELRGDERAPRGSAYA